MPIYVYMAAVAVGLSLPLLAWSVAGDRSVARVVRQNLRAANPQPIARLTNATNDVRRRLPGGYVTDIERRLSRAAVKPSLTVDRYLGMKLIAAVLAVLVGALVGARLGGPATTLMPIVAFLGAWVMPDLRLDGIAQAREVEMELQLPDILDQLTISIEAGLGFEAAMARVVERGDGPVVAELTRVLQDMRLGIPRDNALAALADRTNAQDLRTFANAMAQAGRHGLPIADVLRAQAVEAREKRKYRAEERAQKIPVKILLPLILCILPSLFIVILGPAILRYQGTGFGG